MWAVEISNITFILLFHVRIQLNNESQWTFCFRKLFQINTNKLLIFLKLHWMHSLMIMNGWLLLLITALSHRKVCQNPTNGIVQIGEQLAAGRDVGVLAGNKLHVLAAHAGSRDSWQSPGLHWQEHSQQMCWSGFSPLLCAHWSISRHDVQFHPSHPPCANTGKALIAVGEFSVGHSLQWPWLEHPALNRGWGTRNHSA